MGRKKKKRATQRKKCTTENEDDESGTDCCSCNSLPCACNGEDSEKECEINIMGLQANLRLKLKINRFYLMRGNLSTKI